MGEGGRGEGGAAGESGSFSLARDALRSGRSSKNGGGGRGGGGSESWSLDGSGLSSWAMSALQQGRNKYRQAMGLAPQDISLKDLSFKDLSSPHGALSPHGLHSLHSLSILGGEEAEIRKTKNKLLTILNFCNVNMPMR